MSTHKPLYFFVLVAKHEYLSINNTTLYICLSLNNIASQSMMEKNRFVVLSKWNYYSTSKLYRKSETDEVRMAILKDTEAIRRYLKQSGIFRAAAENYVDFWR
jgi:hypothetical protein